MFKATFVAAFIFGLGLLACGGSEDSAAPDQGQVQSVGDETAAKKDWCSGKNNGWYCVDDYRVRGCYNGVTTHTYRCGCWCVYMPPGVDDYCENIQCD